MDLLEAAPAFIPCLELGGSTFRGTDLLAPVGNQLLFVHCREVLLFQRVI